MTRRHLVIRSLLHYWRTNFAVVAGVAAAVSVLGGALMVGDSVRGTLRDLAFQRLGATSFVLTSTGFFRESLADDLKADSSFTSAFTGVTPLVVTRATVSVQGRDRRVTNVAVYGVDRRFWNFHGIAGVEAPVDRNAFASPALAREAGLVTDGTVLVRVQRPSDVPLESLHGRKDDVGRTLRLTIARVLPREALGEFSLEMQQGDVRALFVPLDRLQSELEIDGRVNALLVSGTPAVAGIDALERLVRSHVTVTDLGLRVNPLEGRRAVSVDSDAGLLTRAQSDAANAALTASGLKPERVFTYLANTIRIGSREIPYSLVAAVDLTTIDAAGLKNRPLQAPTSNLIVLNSWAAGDLGARPGDRVMLEYYVWVEPGELVTRSAEFTVAGIVPVRDEDRDLAPTYPGITNSPTLDSWNPPFPLDLRRVRPKDEQYWHEHRTTPKAYVAFEVGQELWSSRFGAMTSVRADPGAGRLDRAAGDVDASLRQHLDPFAAGLRVADVRAVAARSAVGATDFGAYFLYFSFFLVVSALLLAALFFKLGVEQRAREVGLLRAVGLDEAGIRRLFLDESAIVALAGCALGVAGAVGYGWLVITGLGTWWIGAVGTSSLSLHVSPLSLAIGALGGFAAALVCTWWALRSLGTISERSLLVGGIEHAHTKSARRRGLVVAGISAAAVGGGLLVAAALGLASGTGAFFGAGSALLIAALCLIAYRYRASSPRPLTGRGPLALVRLGARNTSARPSRSVLAAAIIAAATFLLIAVDAFRREPADSSNPRSGTGGYALVVETLLPVAYDLSTPAGRTALNLTDLNAQSVQPFRLRPGDDTSCLNLYQPQDPRILGARAEFLAQGRFAFHATLASTDAERANPWLLLDRREPDGAVPVIGDANSMTYVLKKAIGDDIVIRQAGRDVRLRLVATLEDSIFQRELVMAESRFLELFPDEQGYHVLLVDTPSGQENALSQMLGDALADFGADVSTTTNRIAAFHEVEHTYLSTFQTLGGLGLLVGTVGLAAVLLRNALERRRELALLGAVGYRRSHIAFLLTAESASVLAAGLVAGGAAAALAVWPALSERGSFAPLTPGGFLLVGGVFVGGLAAALVAAWLATRGSMLEALRSE